MKKILVLAVLACRGDDGASSARCGVALRRRLQLPVGEIVMKKILIIAALAFALVAGTATVMTVHPQHAVATPCGGSAC